MPLLSRFGMVALAACLLAIRAAGGDGKSDDLKSLQGSWKIVEIDGKKATGVQAGVKIVIKDNQITFWDFEKPDKPLTFQLDAAKNPKQFDVLLGTKGKKQNRVLGIYELKGNSFKLLQSLAEPEVRPKNFEAKGEPVFVFERLQ